MKLLKVLLLVFIAAIISSCGLNRMVNNYDDVDYSVTPEVLENKGGDVELEIKGFIPEKYFHPKASVEITPVVKYDGGEKALESFRLKGEKAKGEGTVISKKQGGSFTYNTTFEYEAGMEDAIVVTEPVASLKNKSETLGQTQLAEGVIITSTRIKHSEKSTMLPHGYEEETIISENSSIYFAQNFANLNWRLPLNKKEHTKEDLAAMKDFIRKGWEIKDIDLNAWASPEGEIDFNEDLAKDRAKTGKRYLTKELNKIAAREEVPFENAEDITIESNPRGEDWNGFMKAVKSSNLEQKQTILNVVRSQPDLKKREQEIRNMTMLFKELEEKVLPSLRRVEFTVNAYEPKHSDEELKDLIFVDPDTLDINEMLYAATLQSSSDKKIKAYDVITGKHANCFRAHNNQAAEYLLQGNLENAEKALEKAKAIKATAEVHNNFAVLELKKENFEKAQSYLEKAKKAGINTSYNRGIVDLINGDFASAESNFRVAKCDYNLALALLMNDKTSEAIETLECADKGAEEYYLMAVAHARNNQQEQAIRSLEKAISIEDTLKERAKTDKEFIDYFEEDDFDRLVN